MHKAGELYEIRNEFIFNHERYSVDLGWHDGSVPLVKMLLNSIPGSATVRSA